MLKTILVARKDVGVSRVPDAGTVLTAVAIVLIAVIIWVLTSLLRGSVVDPMETVTFAFVFAFLYFSGLYYTGGQNV